MNTLPAGRQVPLHALFQQRVGGDDAILALTRLRFEQAGLAAEVYAGSAGELNRMLAVTPRGARPPMVHLPRDVNLLDPDHRARVAGIAAAAGDRVSGFVVHDRKDLPQRLDEVAAAASAFEEALTRAGPARLFVEYAAGLPPEEFLAVGERLRGHDRIGLCIDTGHVGIRQARRHFARRRGDFGDHPLDLADLTVDDPRLDELADDVNAAVAAALPDLVALIDDTGALGLPVHAHLHDGHPLVRGLADHFSFLTWLTVPSGAGHDRQGAAGRRDLAPLYGPGGLFRIIAALRQACPDRLSLTLEIHQWRGRLPLGDAAGLFTHWRDLTNAERTNAWLGVIAENAILVHVALDQAEHPRG